MSGRSSYNLSSSHDSRNGWMMRRENTSLHASPSPLPTGHRQPPSASSSASPEACITQGQDIDDLWPIFSYEDRVGQSIFPFRRVPTSTHSNVQVFELGNVSARTYPRTPPRVPPHLAPQLVSFSRNDPVVPADSSEESKLTQDEQNRALNKLRKETYNPLLNRKMSTRSNYQPRDWAILSRQTEVGKDNENGQKCAICLEDFQIKEVVTLTPCNHMFHDDCIVPWVKSYGKCPVCRHAIINPGRERSERAPSMAVDNNPGRERREGVAALPMAVGYSPSDNYATTTLVRGRPIYDSGYGFVPRNSLAFLSGNINDRLFEREMVSLVRAMEAAFE